MSPAFPALENSLGSGMRLIILDRDGVINKDSAAYIKSPFEWTPLPGSLEAIAELFNGGYTVVVCTNQSGISRRLFNATTLDAIHEKMKSASERTGGHIDGVFVCPHGPDDHCSCRKPEPGLLLRVGAHYGISLHGVPVVGDSLRDLEAARRVGARPILVLTGNGRQTLKNHCRDGVEVYNDLADAARALVLELETKNERKE